MQVFVFCKKNVIFFLSLSKIIVTMINNNVTLDVSKTTKKTVYLLKKLFYTVSL